MSNFNIAVIPGDGIGPEIIKEATKVLKKIGEKYNHNFNLTEVLAGGAAIDATGECLPEETLTICLSSDSVLLGALGGPKWDNVPIAQRPEKALLKLRSALELYCNLRPAIMHASLSSACPLKQELTEGGFDIMIVRELTGGIYFGDRGYRQGKYGEEAYDTEAYSPLEIERIAKRAFEVASKRGKKLISVDKSNVLESSRLWRKTVDEISKNYSDIELEHMYVDNAAMQLVRAPKQFDVMLTTNMFGDILSDEASMITGSIGMLPSASLGDTKRGMYEPIHGSAPDIAGQNIANPIATILSVAMMLRYSFDLQTEALAIESAVTKVLNKNYRTKDIFSKNTTLVSTQEMGDLIIEYI